MPAKPTTRLKIILLGEVAVGKTSLVRRYVDGSFSETYLATIGVSVSKRTEVLVTALHDDRTVEVRLVIWDIMGSRRIMDLIAEAYFNGASGGFFVFDLTRPETLEAMGRWVEAARRFQPGIPFMVLGNKADLGDQLRVSDAEASDHCRALDLPYLPTSARSGMNVEAAFRGLCMEMLRQPRVGGASAPWA